MKDYRVYSIVDENYLTWTDGYDREQVMKRAQEMYNEKDEINDREINMDITYYSNGEIVGETQEIVILKGGLE